MSEPLLKRPISYRPRRHIGRVKGAWCGWKEICDTLLVVVRDEAHGQRLARFTEKGINTRDTEPQSLAELPMPMPVW